MYSIGDGGVDAESDRTGADCEQTGLQGLAQDGGAGGGAGGAERGTASLTGHRHTQLHRAVYINLGRGERKAL